MSGIYAKTPVVFQMEAAECGAASLAMILAYYGKHVPLEKLRIDTGASRDGCKAGNIMRAAKIHGLECLGYRKKLTGLLKLTPPCIIHWKYDHFVVYEGIKRGHACINDPAAGRRKLTMEELGDGFSGVVLTFRITEGFSREKKSADALKRLAGRLKGKYEELFTLFYSGLLLLFPGVFLPLTAQVFIDEALEKGGGEWFLQFMMLVIVTVAIGAFLTYWRGVFLKKLENRLTLVTAYGFFMHLFRLPMEFFDQRYAGDLMGRADNNEKVNTFLAGELVTTVLDAVSLCVYLTMMLLYSVKLALAGLCVLAAGTAVSVILAGRTSGSGMKYQQDKSRLAGLVFAGFGITGTIKASGAEHTYVGKLLENLDAAAETEQAAGKYQGLSEAVSDAAEKLAYALVVMAGAFMIIRGTFTVGMLAAFTGFLFSFSASLRMLVRSFGKIQKLRAHARRVADIENYDDREEFGEDRGGLNVGLQGNVAFKDVSFGYSRLEPPLIDSFDCSIATGRSVAFVGRSGCGKSTVARLAGGLYEPWRGQILYDGMRLKDIPAGSINTGISVVSQNITLFSGSIRDNITMWNDHIPEKDVIAAAKDACIHEDILGRPGGYDHRLAEKGANMSGGQRQRMEIARALAVNPAVLIMDEATSALDPVVEKKILDNIRRRGCTCIMTAHRLSAVRDCDEIIVMDRGRIVQRGRHEELADVAGYYREFMRND